jgi:hypothetical protein
VGTDEDNAGRPIAPLSGFERIGTTYLNWVNMLDLAHRGHLGGYFPYSIYCLTLVCLDIRLTLNHSPACTEPIVYSTFLFPFSIFTFASFSINININMCGDTNRPTFGGTIAVLFPREDRLPSNPGSLSSSPDSVVSSASSTSTLSSYSLFFRDAETKDRNTKAIFQIDDEDTFTTLRGCGNVNVRIE